MNPIAWNAKRLTSGGTSRTEFRGKWINYAVLSGGSVNWREIDTRFLGDASRYIVSAGPWTIEVPDSATKAIQVVNTQSYDVHSKQGIGAPPLLMELIHPSARPVAPVVREGREWQAVYPDAIDDGIDIAVGQWHGRGVRAEHLYVIRREPSGTGSTISIVCQIRSGDTALPIPDGVEVPSNAGFSTRHKSDSNRGISMKPTVAWYYDSAGKLVVTPIQSKMRRVKGGTVELVKMVPRALIRTAIAARPNGELRVDTTSTFYPDASEMTSMDGHVAYDTPQNVTWAAAHDGAGTFAWHNSTSVKSGIATGTTTDRWSEIYRTMMLVDSSALPDSDTIDSATLSVYATIAVDQLGSQYVNLYSSSPVSNTAIANSDYGNFGTTAFSSNVSVGSVSTSAYTDFALNASGLAAISATGVSKYGLRIVSDADNAEPAWQSAKSSAIHVHSAERTGTTQDPKLVVVHTSAPPPPFAGPDRTKVARAIATQIGSNIASRA